MTPENKRIPDWALRERQTDLAWIAENLEMFCMAARDAFEDVGRGVIVVDTTIEPTPGAGHPYGYFLRQQIEEIGTQDIIRLMSEYNPDCEFIVALLKTNDRISAYRLRKPGTEQEDWDFRYIQDREAALAVATIENVRQLFEGAEQLEAEGAPSAAQELHEDAELILQRLATEDTVVEPGLRPPDIETLMAWEAEGGCEAVCSHGCWVEPDGTCSHGKPSWLLKLGLI